MNDTNFSCTLHKVIIYYYLKICFLLIAYKGDLEMFKKIRRQDRKIETVEAIDILKNGEYGVMSTINENGYAYGVPLNYVYINDSIYFHSAITGNKLDNIRENNKVSFCVVGETNILPGMFSTMYESVIVFGKAVEVLDTEKYEALLALVDKYSNQYIEEGKEFIKNASNKIKVIKICIERITGKAKKNKKRVFYNE